MLDPNQAMEVLEQGVVVELWNKIQNQKKRRKRSKKFIRKLHYLSFYFRVFRSFQASGRQSNQANHHHHHVHHNTGGGGCGNQQNHRKKENKVGRKKQLEFMDSWNKWKHYFQVPESWPVKSKSSRWRVVRKQPQSSASIIAFRWNRKIYRIPIELILVIFGTNNEFCRSNDSSSKRDTGG